MPKVKVEKEFGPVESYVVTILDDGTRDATLYCGRGWRWRLRWRGDAPIPFTNEQGEKERRVVEQLHEAAVSIMINAT